MSKTGRSPRAFTLLELAITLTIIVVLVAICLPGITQWIRRNELSRAETELMELVSDAKRMALRSGQEFQVRFDSSSYRLILASKAPLLSRTERAQDSFGTKFVALSKDIQIQFLSIQNQTPIPDLILTPQGTISSGNIRISHKSGMVGLWRTNRLTGTIQVVK